MVAVEDHVNVLQTRVRTALASHARQRHQLKEIFMPAPLYLNAPSDLLKIILWIMSLRFKYVCMSVQQHVLLNEHGLWCFKNLV